MGSILSAIRDYGDHYEYLCDKYGEKYVDVYTPHHDWLKSKSYGSTLTFEQFQASNRRKVIEKRIREISDELNNLNKELLEIDETLKN